MRRWYFKHIHRLANGSGVVILLSRRVRKLSHDSTRVLVVTMCVGAQYGIRRHSLSCCKHIARLCLNTRCIELIAKKKSFATESCTRRPASGIQFQPCLICHKERTDDMAEGVGTAVSCCGTGELEPDSHAIVSGGSSHRSFREE